MVEPGMPAESKTTIYKQTKMKQNINHTKIKRNSICWQLQVVADTMVHAGVDPDNGMRHTLL